MTAAPKDPPVPGAAPVNSGSGTAPTADPRAGAQNPGPSTAAPTTRLRPPRHRVERRAVRWWALQSLALFVPLLAVAIAAHVFWEAARPWTLVVAAAAAVLLLVGTIVEPRWRYAVHRWEVTDEAVYGLSGWWVREWRVAPISRIQTVDAVRGPFEQVMGLATLRVTTASSQGAIDIVGLDHEVAAETAENLRAVTQRTPGDAT
jgi:membrane protein YdbS with pleckstrin-like domain